MLWVHVRWGTPDFRISCSDDGGERRSSGETENAVHARNGVRPGAKHRQRGRSFRPLVIHGGARARSVPRESSWEAALELINLGFLISQGNYLAFLQASMTVLEAYNRTNLEKN